MYANLNKTYFFLIYFSSYSSLYAHPNFGCLSSFPIELQDMSQSQCLLLLPPKNCQVNLPKNCSTIHTCFHRYSYTHTHTHSLTYTDVQCVIACRTCISWLKNTHILQSSVELLGSSSLCLLLVDFDCGRFRTVLSRTESRQSRRTLA